MGERLNSALRALAAELAGRTPAPKDAQALRAVESFTGAKRRLADYAPSTRRRYLAAARRHDRRPNVTEYQRRQRDAARGGVTAQQWRTVRKLARRNEEALRNDSENEDFYFDDDTLRDVLRVFGYEFTVQVLREQWQSIKAWEKGDQVQGNSPPGTGRFFGKERRERETRWMRITGHGGVGNTDFLYYYHGSRN